MTKRALFWSSLNGAKSCGKRSAALRRADSLSRQVEDLRSVKAAFWRGQSGLRGAALGRWGEVTWHGGRVRWEQFLDLLTVAEAMLFIFGRLPVSGAVPRIRRGGGSSRGIRCALWRVHAGEEGKKKTTNTHTCEMSLDQRCSLTQLYFTVSLVGPRGPTTPAPSNSWTPSPVHFFFQPNFLSSVLLHQPPHHIHHWTPASICFLPTLLLACYSSSFSFSKCFCRLLTNVSNSPLSITETGRRKLSRHE